MLRKNYNELTNKLRNAKKVSKINLRKSYEDFRNSCVLNLWQSYDELKKF